MESLRFCSQLDFYDEKDRGKENDAQTQIFVTATGEGARNS